MNFIDSNPQMFPEEFYQKNAIVVKGVDKNGRPLCKRLREKNQTKS